MLKIWSMVSPATYPTITHSLTTTTLQKQQQQQAENADGAGKKKKKVTAAQLRVQRGQHLPIHPPNASRSIHAY